MADHYRTAHTRLGKEQIVPGLTKPLRKNSVFPESCLSLKFIADFFSFAWFNLQPLILQFAEQGEKTGWSYVTIPPEIAAQLKPGFQKIIPCKGKIG